ncbi:hypothetical protein NIES4106_61810 (plasmid) [Fischerella sp. NIES-4106]|nr:hypothetical protein NIES4106_61810 [Fischerella sp. NIES-4106]
MATTILISTAAEQLGISEEQLRILLEPIYKNASTIKRLSTKTLKTLAETLQEQALQQDINQDIDVEGLEADIANQPTFLQEEQNHDDSADDTFEPTDIDSRVDSNQGLQEETAIATIPSEEIELKVRQVLDTNINLNSQVFDLARITQTLAVLAADEAVESFKSIYAARLNQGIDDVICEFSQSAINSIEQLRGQKTEDFFKGLQTNYSRSNVKENMQKLSEYIV